MKIEFDGLWLENYGRFLELTHFDLRSLEPGLYFVSGRNLVARRLDSNGAGKTTLLNAISWCLYGKTANELKAVDITARHGDGKAHVALAIRCDGKKHRIERTAPAHLTLNGKEVSQENIDRLMRMSYEVYRQCGIFGQREPLFFDLTNKDQLQLLSDVNNLDVWETRSTLAADRAAELTVHAVGLEHSLTRARSHLEIIKRNLKEALDRADSHEAEVAKKLKQFAMLKKEHTAELVKLEKAAAAALRVAQHCATRQGENDAELFNAKDKLFYAERKQIARRMELKHLNEKHDELLAELNTLGEADECPTCGQAIKGTELHKHKRETRAKVKGVAKELYTLTNDKSIDDKVAHWKHVFIQAKARTVTQQSLVDDARAKYDKAVKRAVELKASAKAMDDQIKEYREQRNPHVAYVKELKVDLTRVKADIAETERLLKRTKRRENRAKFWIKGFKEIRLFIIEEVLAELELATNAIVEDMGLLGWKVKYSIERETQRGTTQTGLNIWIMGPKDRKPVKWKTWSGGEGQRLRIAGALALSEVLLNHAGIEIDLEILDEPTTSIGSSGVDDLCTMLAERAGNLGRRILYVDHLAVESASFASTIVVENTREGSRIIM